MKFLLCVAAFFCSLAQAQTRFPISGLWWDPEEPGWGVSIHERGDIVFATLLVYGDDGGAQWYVAPRMECRLIYGDTVCDGAVYSATGPAFEPYDPFDSSRVAMRQVGAIHVEVTNGVDGSLTYSIDGRSVSRGIRPLLPAGSSSVFSGLWIDPAEPGWGVSVQHRDDVMFVTLLAYDARGIARWYVAPRARRAWGMAENDVWYTGDLYRASGPVPTSANSFDATRVSLRREGELFLSILGGVDGAVSFTIDGMRVERPITPFRF